MRLGVSILVSGEWGQPQSGGAQLGVSASWALSLNAATESECLCHLHLVLSDFISLLLESHMLTTPHTPIVQPPIAPKGQQLPRGGICYTVTGWHLGATQRLWGFPYQSLW